MQPLAIRGATRILAKDQDEYIRLHVKDEPLPNGGNLMWSLWEPTPAELATLAAGGSVRLGILGFSHPPVVLSVQQPPEPDDS